MKQWVVLCSIKKIKTIYTASEKVNKQMQKSFMVNKNFCCCQTNIHKKLLMMLFFRVLLKNTTLITEIKNNLLPLYKVKYKRQTHLFKRSIIWYLQWKKVTHKKLVKACRSILQRIWSQGCYYCLIFVEQRTPQDSQLKARSPNFFWMWHRTVSNIFKY